MQKIILKNSILRNGENSYLIFTFIINSEVNIYGVVFYINIVHKSFLKQIHLSRILRCRLVWSRWSVTRAVLQSWVSWGLLKWLRVTRSPTPPRALRVIHGHGAAAQGFTWGGLAKTHSKPTAVRKWHSTVTSRERALTRGKKAAEINTDNSYPWTNPLDLKTRAWLMPPNLLLTAARRRKGEFIFSRAGSLCAPCCGRRSETHRWMFFLPRHARGRVAHGGGRGNTREKGRSPCYCKKHQVYIISLRHMQSKEGPQQGAACPSVSPVVPIRGVSTGRMRKWS